MNTMSGAGAVGARAASRYGSGSPKILRLLAAPALQHWSAILREKIGNIKKILPFC
jgi:hypothetical protein